MTPIIVKLVQDHKVIETPTCGTIREILAGKEFSPGIALALDIRSTKPHYHNEFDEVYLVLDGELVLRLYDPRCGRTTDQRLAANELCVITRGIHHRIVESSDKNRLCVLAVPCFNASDEHLSDVI